jgi:hypothetical protein
VVSCHLFRGWIGVEYTVIDQQRPQEYTSLDLFSEGTRWQLDGEPWMRRCIRS